MSFQIEDAVASPFAELRKLLEGIEPGRDPIDLSLGGPRHPMPACVTEILTKTAQDFGTYPPIQGTPGLRRSIANWHDHRYPALKGSITADNHIAPLDGSREGLFSAIFPAINRRADIDRPAILIPNPFYQCYAAAALAAGAEPIFLNATAQTGFLPDLESLDAALFARTAVMFLCSPSNPQGAVANAQYLEKAISICQQHDIMLFSDECYSEIYSDTPPPGALEVSQEKYGHIRNIIAFNSLSKRSSLPGLRSGFAAGDADFMRKYIKFRNVACPQIPLPIQHISQALWADETHVRENRTLYAEKFDAADRILGTKFAYKRPKGAFFLWLDMKEKGGGENATKTLWKGYGVKVLPGAYLAKDGSDGENPGENYIRVALVQDLAQTIEALQRIVGI